MSGLNVLSLFAGIGGLDLGLERAGMRVVGQVEIEPFCRFVLARHWPEVPCHDDVRTAPTWWRSRPRPAVHVVAGGFPCQPFSTAGRRRGIGDERWGWPWFFDVVRQVRPRYVLVENVAALLRDADAFGWMLGDLAALGFDAQWSVLSACAVGAPHVRERLFVVAHPHGEHGPLGMADPRQPARRRRPPHAAGGHRQSPWVHPVDGLMEAERRSRRVVDGLPDRLEPARVRALGNAVVPAVGEVVGRLIVAHHRQHAG
ncbi:DNA cytosine methyltransferase [Micromonospora sp. B11E3]|uniref:DNA cytosine methyltransferase n=1 Tax=Micromonospora sp. B11E3 TaxID=3153562 RepID=UPI00325CEFF9